jgi:gamma-glutamyltranspeptidase/glutathione hydrolase
MTRSLLRAGFLLLTINLAARSQTPAPAPAPAEPRAQPTRPAGPLVGQWQAAGSHGAVVAGGAEAVAAGLAMLKDGGNAVDAAVTTILAQSVTDANQFCFGGEVPFVIYNAERKVVEVLAGQGGAPRLATRDYYLQHGGIKKSGIEAAAVPATLDVCLTALERHGTRTFAQAVAPALRILDRHEHPWHADLARTVRRLIDTEKTASDRRQGLHLVADYFYRGPVAREIDAWSRAKGGLIRYSDLATHVTRVEEPVTVSYRGYTVVKCGPWTQGPALLEALQLLEGFDVAALRDRRADWFHLGVEALKLAFADRDAYFADPLYTDVPLAELLAPRYAAMRRDLIDLRHASLVQRPGDPRGDRPLLDERAAAARLGIGTGGPTNDTTTCIAADGQGNVVAATPSGWTGVLAGDTGVWLGSRLQSFNLWPGHPNCIEAGKRPRITLTPTLVLKDGRPIIAVSVAGGDNQDQATLQLLVDVIDFGMTPAEAVTAPRFITAHFLGSFLQAPPKLGSLSVNPEIGEQAIADLESRGHRITQQKGSLSAAPTLLRIDTASGRIDAAGDPRARRHAGAY